MSVPFSDNPIVMSEADQAALQRWVDAMRPVLALSDWDITVTRREATDGAYASSYIRDYSDVSIVALCEDWHTWTPEELRHNLTHELLHAHFQRVTSMAEKLVESELGKRTEAVIEAAISLVEEQSIDRLAGAIARMLPLVILPEPEA